MRNYRKIDNNGEIQKYCCDCNRWIIGSWCNHCFPIVPKASFGLRYKGISHSSVIEKKARREVKK